MNVIIRKFPHNHKILYYILQIPELSKMSHDVRRIRLLNDMQDYNCIRFWWMT